MGASTGDNQAGGEVMQTATITKIENKTAKNGSAYLFVESQQEGRLSVWDSSDIRVIQEGGLGSYQCEIEKTGTYKNASKFEREQTQPEPEPPAPVQFRTPIQLIRSDALRLAVESYHAGKIGGDLLYDSAKKHAEYIEKGI
jgi:hypothetical protein